MRVLNYQTEIAFLCLPACAGFKGISLKGSVAVAPCGDSEGRIGFIGGIGGQILSQCHCLLELSGCDSGSCVSNGVSWESWCCRRHLCPLHRDAQGLQGVLCRVGLGLIDVGAELGWCEGMYGGVLAGKGRDGDFVEEELSLILANGRMELVHRLSPVVFLADFL